MLALYDWLLARPAAEIERARAGDASAGGALAAEIVRALGTGAVAAAASTEMAAKRALGSRAERVSRFARAWPRLQGDLARRLVSAGTMQRRLRAVGAAAHPSDLGIPLAALAADYRRARLIRRRYTLLDLLEDLGWLDRAVASLFIPGGFWAEQSITPSASAAGSIHS
jgi:glycerol-1-phosphate dehydrogenase [NAD(P)+]